MSLRSTASYRGTVADHARNREFVYESKVERGFIYISLASSLVEDYLDQPPPVEYSD
ncbi:hypothetical protein [Mesorhizobium australafricanum]|uniref:KTSC domain-containing protein n=1 Tax=Mesorhizobium australafricanum TaxID=3072311 RepID=A0ABU4X4I8_9HYPH|nr:hypothetical protein [Mesorhizobium sp. VK3E]MDX8443218.1 hypothetical protein [Mesorhizobium sp. VK3E]